MTCGDSRRDDENGRGGDDENGRGGDDGGGGGGDRMKCLESRAGTPRGSCGNRSGCEHES